MRPMAGNFEAKQSVMLRRWATAPQHSPLSEFPDLTDLFAKDSWNEKEIEVIYEPSEVTEEETTDREAIQELPDDEMLRIEALEREEEARRAAKARVEEEHRRDELMVGRIEEWFLENFEPPAPDSKYDDYVWGCPYNAQSVIETFSPSYIDDSVLDDAVNALERISTNWVPIGSKLEIASTRAQPISGEEAYSQLQERVRALEELLNQIPEQAPGIGHNFPPEPLDVTPVDNDDRKELQAAIHIIQAQPLIPQDKGKEVRKAGAVVEGKIHKVRGWLARQGDTFATEAVKEAGKQFGKWAPRALWLLLIDRMLSVTETITHWLNLVFHLP